MPERLRLPISRETCLKERDPNTDLKLVHLWLLFNQPGHYLRMCISYMLLDNLAFVV